jgi:hypothetical protein
MAGVISREGRQKVKLAVMRLSFRRRAGSKRVRAVERLVRGIDESGCEMLRPTELEGGKLRGVIQPPRDLRWLRDFVCRMPLAESGGRALMEAWPIILRLKLRREFDD